MPTLAELVDGVIGVDTHRDSLVAAAVTPIGALLAQAEVTANARGYHKLLDFARQEVSGPRCWALEGTGSYGAGLSSFLVERARMMMEKHDLGALVCFVGENVRYITSVYQALGLPASQVSKGFAQRAVGDRGSIPPIIWLRLSYTCVCYCSLAAELAQRRCKRVWLGAPEEEISSGCLTCKRSTSR